MKIGILADVHEDVEGLALALDLLRKNNSELIKGVDRATTTTVAALRTAVMVAQALVNQKLVLDQISALNTTTGNMIETTSEMLKKQTGQIHEQAASSTIEVIQQMFRAQGRSTLRLIRRNDSRDTCHDPANGLSRSHTR